MTLVTLKIIIVAGFSIFMLLVFLLGILTVCFPPTGTSARSAPVSTQVIYAMLFISLGYFIGMMIGILSSDVWRGLGS